MQLFYITFFFKESDIIVRSCGNAVIETTCENQIIEGKNKNREVKICYSSCSYDGCNNSIKLQTKFLINIFLIILLIFLIIN